ncbi:hypothetical protein MKEN_00497200 [Mycena kentingensis (nom. inval.)]|nr:hypothetical protein MKEN_00497200 [Mycena kentingensis (nom. inval.)]
MPWPCDPSLIPEPPPSPIVPQLPSDYALDGVWPHQQVPQSPSMISNVNNLTINGGDFTQINSTSLSPKETKYLFELNRKLDYLIAAQAASDATLHAAIISQARINSQLAVLVARQEKHSRTQYTILAVWSSFFLSPWALQCL